MMSSKIKTITLTSGWTNNVVGECNHYRIERLTDTVEYTPGQLLHKNEVQSLCANRQWKVTIVAYKPGGE